MPFGSVTERRLRQELAGFVVGQEKILDAIVVGVSVCGGTPQVVQRPATPGTEGDFAPPAGGDPEFVTFGDYVGLELLGK